MDIAGLQGLIFSFSRSFPLISHHGYFLPFGGADIAGLQGLIFSFSLSFPLISHHGYFLPFGGTDIAGLRGLIFSFSLSFPLISHHSGYSGYSGLAAGTRQTRRDLKRVVYAIRYRHSTNDREGAPGSARGE